jgi:hypothetical protein
MAMNFMIKIDDRIAVLGFERLEDKKYVRVYDAVEDVISISSRTDISPWSSAKHFNGISDPDLKSLLMAFIDASGREIIHFSLIDDSYYSTDIKISDAAEAVRLCLADTDRTDGKLKFRLI